MKALANRFLGIYLDQSGWVNKWEKFPLKVQEIKYAALDAWVRLKIFQEMERQEQQTKEECLTTTKQYEGNVYIYDQEIKCWQCITILYGCCVVAALLNGILRL